jgi:hypothetical protein
MRKRYTRTQDQCRDAVPVDVRKITHQNARARRSFASVGLVVPTDDLSPTRDQSARRRDTRSRKPKDGDGFAFEERYGDHRLT